ncbi:hypothetical protein EXIGLDRAFT_758540 [Exidia glandulosa HHB12029]|uniref:F-box domain-containing protein n=1 Tax=Exidia glandulosa HHB12029 TaxID=1314781 RepID=A0A165QYE8_EXIGL|nr:hypothetical protein EXIGLDRAFT_758540 [Exidia glandulosa HHB12029]
MTTATACKLSELSLSPHKRQTVRSPAVLSLIFDYLAFQELLAASHVSVRWRTLVHRHRAFCGSVELTSAKEGAFRLFKLQLDASRMHDITVRVDIRRDDQSDIAYDWDLRALPGGLAALTVVKAHLPRISDLSIHFDVSWELQLWWLAQQEAPCLRSLRVGFPTCGARLTGVGRLFGGNAPCLSEVVMDHIGQDVDCDRMKVVLADELPPPLLLFSVTPARRVLEQLSKGSERVSGVTPHSPEDHTRRLPAELLACVIDWLDFEDIVCVSHVSARWRAVSRNHDGFWKDIRLESLTSAAVTIFLAQLACSRDNVVNLCIKVDEVNADVIDTILPAVADCLRRLETLELTTNGQYAVETFEALRGPAPCLTHFSLTFHIDAVSEEDMGDPTLPSGIFGGISPQLRVVHVCRMRMPPSPIAAFKLVEDASFESDGDEPLEINSLFAAFPIARRLKIDAPAFDIDPSCNALQSTVDNLEMLDVCFHESGETTAFLSALPGAQNISIIETCDVHDYSTALAMLGYLDSPLRIELARHCAQDENVAAIVGDGNLARDRVFRYLPGPGLSFLGVPKLLPMFFHWEAMCTEIRIAYSLWPLLTGDLPAFTEVRHITLVLDEPGSCVLGLAGWTFDCEKLETLCLKAREPLTVTAEDVCDFANSCFRPYVPGVALQLEGPITLVGGPALLQLALLFSQVVRVA